MAKAAIDAGAEGTKCSGAGGGGIFIIYCNWMDKKKIANTMIENGCSIWDFSWSFKGLQTYSLNGVVK